MKKLIFTLLILAISQTLSAQNEPDWVVAAVEYQKEGVMMDVDADNNAIIAGDRLSYLGAAHIYVRKFDVLGNLLWEQTDMSGVAGTYEKAAWVNVDSGNNIYVCGYRYSGTSNMYPDTIIALKYDPAGNLLWKRQFPDSYLGGLPMRSELDASGNFYIGTMNTSPPGFNLYKLDPAGTLLFHVADSSTSNVSFNNMRIKDDKVVMTGYASLGSIACVVEFDTTGNFLWGNNFSTWGAMDLEIDSAHNVYFISRQENQISPNSSFDVKLFKLNPNGSLDTSYSYDFGNSVDFVDRMTLVNGKISIIGWAYTSGMNWLTMQTDMNGNLLWHAIYDETNFNDEIPYWISAKPNGEVFVSGKGGPDTVSATGSAYVRNVTLKYNNGQIVWVDADPYQGYNGLVNKIASDSSLFVLGETAMTAIHYFDINVNTNIVSEKSENNLAVVPNPTNGFTVLNIDLPKPASVQLEVFDVRGRLVKKQTNLQLKQGSNSIPLDLSTADPGIYFGKIESADFSRTVKIIVR